MATNQEPESRWIRRSRTFPDFHLIQVENETHVVAVMGGEPDDLVDGYVQFSDSHILPYWTVATMWNDKGITLDLFESIAYSLAHRAAQDMAEATSSR